MFLQVASFQKLDSMPQQFSIAAQSRLVRVVGEIRGRSLSASHQAAAAAAAQGGRSPFEAGSSGPEITKGYTKCINCDANSAYYGLRSTSTSAVVDRKVDYGIL